MAPRARRSVALRDNRGQFIRLLGFLITDYNAIIVLSPGLGLENIAD